MHMKTSRIILGLVPLVVLGAAAYFWLNRSDPSAGSAPPLAGVPANASAIARGEYLTRAADCVACHTVPGSNNDFAGGVAFVLPFGTIYSSNITPDAETGIGAWTDEDFVRAMHDGVRKDGSHLYPAFPYTSYTALSRDDVLAIKAYLFSLPPINSPERSNELSFPFNQRWAMGFWNAAFFKNQRFQNDESRPAQWNSGAYLATALGHCAECHTPRNFGFGLKHGNELAGEEVQGWAAYDITPDPQDGIGAWTDEQIAAYLKSGHAPGRASASGPMAEVVSNSLQYLAADDVASLVSYLRSVPARPGRVHIAADAGASLATRASAALPAPAAVRDPDDPGLGLFAGNCAGCHSWDGLGRQTVYADLRGVRAVADPAATNITQVILHGSNYRIGEHDIYMPAFAAGYSDAEVAALSNFVVRYFGNRPGTLAAKDVAQRRKDM
jgi:mono/diheme cytochrome c family protein